MRRILFLPLLVLILAGCTNDAADAPSEPASDAPVAEAIPASCEEADLVILEEELGEGAEAVRESVVRVNYAGRFEDGQEFDSGQNVEMALPEMIPGFREGIAGMKVGGRRQLTVPPMLGYGPAGGGPIPPCATLIFDVELLEIVR